MSLFAQKIIATALYLCVLLGIGTADAYFTKDKIKYPTERNTTATTGVAPVAEKDVFSILTARNITTTTPSEESLLQRIAPASENMTTRVLLQNNDRLALLSYVESPKVKEYFNALKVAVSASFSSSLQGLVDETTTPDAGPTYNILSFKDPAISEEKMIFLRVRDRLYEFHVVDGKDGVVGEIIEELKK
jgi:hypothetical protein